MNDKTTGNRGPRRVAALSVVAAVAVLAAACGGRSAPATTSSALAGTATYPQELALAQCMRGHGVPDFPDPSASGGFSANVLSMIDDSQTQAAYGACRHLLPDGGPSITQLQQQAQQEQQEQRKLLPTLLKFAQCMRGHGVPDYPDPAGSGQSTPAAAKGAALDPSSPQFQAAASACQRVLPAGLHISAHTSTHRS